MIKFDVTKRHYYAGYSYMGINFTYDSPCWESFAFDSKKERDNWVNENRYNDQGNIVAEAITRRVAFKIAGLNSKYIIPGIDNNRLVAYCR